MATFSPASSSRVTLSPPTDPVPPKPEVKPGDNELLESVKFNVFSFAYFHIKSLMEHYKADHTIQCKKKAALYKKAKKELTEDDLLAFVRLRSLPYPMAVRRIKNKVEFPTAHRGGEIVSGNRPIIVEINEDEQYYQYKHGDNAVEFYVSFADRKLFGWFQKENLPLATEEVRAMEFPVVCSLRLCLDDIYENGKDKEGNWTKVFPKPIKLRGGAANVFGPAIDENTHELYQPVTSDGANRPTPILLIGTPRMGKLDCGGIYGEEFKGASVETVKDAMTALEPDGSGHYELTNFICMEALEQAANPEVRRGAYSIHQLRTLLRAAMTGFAGARSAIQPNEKKLHELIINTGLWGCGEYGNNPGVICLIQLAAAYFVGYVYDEDSAREKPAIQRLIFYIGPKETKDPIPKHKKYELVTDGIDIFHNLWGMEEIRDTYGNVIPDLFLAKLEKELQHPKFYWRKKNHNQ
ncbi:hypothetical protein HK098_003440 [Nowakowskiella sp. JEL0407]|nr:hypothetical protein HK098_003440 [Nowakowskiella sp. JEL0407]